MSRAGWVLVGLLSVAVAFALIVGTPRKADPLTACSDAGVWPLIGRVVIRDAEHRGIDPELAKSAVVWFGVAGLVWWIAQRRRLEAHAARPTQR